MNRYDIILGNNSRLAMMEKWSPKDYRQEYLGEFVKPTCSVSDGHNNYCPSKPEHFFEYHGKEVGLCKDCYLHYLNGHFDKRFQKKNYGYTIYQID